MPREVFPGSQTFSITPDTAIVLGDPNRADDGFAASQIVDEVQREMGLKIAITPSAPRRILLGLATDPPVASACARHGMHTDARLGDEGYVLYVGADEVVIAANAPVGAFYGAQTLKQLIRANRQGTAIPAMRVRDWPGLRYRGYSDDISRGPIPTMDFFKREIRTMAEFKMNMLTFYTEHVFKIKGHPDIAPDDGLTGEQVAELSAYATKCHVELVGNFQSFGHFGNILRHDAYKECRETMDVLSPVKEQTYKLLADIYDTIAPAYNSKLFNVNCDETYGLGDGPSKELVQKIGVGGVYLMHMKRIHDMLAARGKRMMMWGDIALQHPDIIVAGLPRDTILLSWGYGAAPNYDSAIVPFKKVGFEFMVCPGVSCWSQIFPNYENATVNIQNYVRDGAKNGALGMLNTTWDDDGENLFTWNFYGTNWGAQCAWHPEASDIGVYDSAWSQVSYGTKSDCVDRAVKLLSSCVGIGLARGMNDGAFWESPFGSFPASVKSTQEQAVKLHDVTTEAIALLEQGKREATVDTGDLDYLLFAASRLKFIADSRLARIEAARRYDAAGENPSNPTPAKQALQDALKSFTALHTTLTGMRTEYKRLWDLENRPYSRDGILGRYDGLIRQVADEEDKVNAAITSLDKTGNIPDGGPLGLSIVETTIRNMKAAPAPQPLLPADAAWWDKRWAYRLPIKVDAADVDRTDCPVEMRVNLGSITGDLNSVSLRLVECKPTGEIIGEVPCQFDGSDKVSGNIVFIMSGQTAAKSSRYYELYFDAIGGNAPAPTAPPERVSATDDPRGAWVENSRYKALLGKQGMHLHVWQVKALGNASVTDPGETSYHGFADSGFDDRDAQFDLKREANGPVMVRFRGKSKTTGAEKVLEFYAGLPWVEVMLDRGVGFYWDYDDVHSFAADMPMPGTAIFSNGHTEPVCKSGEQKHNEGRDTTWGAKFRSDGFLLGLITPEIATTHMVGPGGGWGGVGIEAASPTSHFVTYADKTTGKPADILNALQQTLDYRHQVKMWVGKIEERGK
jgi:hypothetical protein